MSLDVIVRNNVRVLGHGTRPILFAHGFGCSQHMWRLVAPAFEADHRVVLFDYVGSGGSRAEAYSAERYGSLRGYAMDVLEVCEALDLRDVVFVGHSVSSMIGVLAALREPSRFSRLVLVAASPCFRNDLPAYAGGFERAQLEELLESMERDEAEWARYLAPLVAGNPDRPELAHEVEASFCATDRWIARRFAEVTFLSDNRRDLPRVSVPSLVLQCSDDVLAPRAVGEYLHQQLRDSTLHRLEASGHAPHLSHPAETIEAIRGYLRAA
jgi:sigma-B regulation protein RsbQ